MGHGHAHAHEHGPHDAHDHHRAHASTGRGALTATLAITASFMIVEVIVGFWSGSLALLADAGHMLNDAAALALSLGVSWIAARPRTAKHTFGFRRAEVMGALANAVTLGIAGGLIVVEAIARLDRTADVRGPEMLATASLGLVANLLSAAILAARGGGSINVRGALLHVLSDALGSVAAMGAGVLILAFGWTLADPIASLAIAVLILWGALRLLRDTVQVLMEAAPAGIDVADLEQTIQSTEGVDAVHDLHVWQLVPGEVLLSAHVVLRPGAHGTDVARLVALRLHQRHAIEHSTIQPEAPASALVELRRKNEGSD